MGGDFLEQFFGLDVPCDHAATSSNSSSSVTCPRSSSSTEWRTFLLCGSFVYPQRGGPFGSSAHYDSLSAIVFSFIFLFFFSFFFFLFFVFFLLCFSFFSSLFSFFFLLCFSFFFFFLIFLNLIHGDNRTTSKKDGNAAQEDPKQPHNLIRWKAVHISTPERRF